MKKKQSKNKPGNKQVCFHHLCRVVVLLCAFFISCNNSETKKETQTSQKEKITYYCPMHPEIHQDHPGKCPKPECSGMELAVKESEEYLDAALKPVSSNVLSKIRLINPEYKNRPVVVDALGYIDYDNFSKFDISSRYSGRIDKLYIRFNYQPIKKGEIVFEVYNADLVNAQENLLYLLKNSPTEKELIETARQKLKLLQLSPEQISEIESSKNVKSTVPIYSKYNGHIHEMLDAKMASVDMSDNKKSSLISVREGMYVERGKVLFNVVDPHRVVLMLKIKAADMAKIHVGQRVDFIVNNDSTMKMKGNVDFIEPVLAANSKSMMIRVNVNNEGHRHKTGSLVNAKITADSFDALWVPASAIVDLGKHKIAWLWKENNFIAVKVETGIQLNNWVEIADGLTEADKIAAEAHYLSDSESFIKINENE